VPDEPSWELAFLAQPWDDWPAWAWCVAAAPVVLPAGALWLFAG
jgi:hypothetical protein